jgi:glyoxylase-like metal-dependent hydrolase (beta-lactamase superfamily II)
MKIYDPLLIRKDPLLLKRVEEMAPDFWWIEGFFPNVFFGSQVTCNSYLIKDGRDLILVDNGRNPVYQEKLIALIDSYRGQVDRLYMTLTQGHLDHAGNNDIIEEVGIDETHFLLNEREIPVLEYTGDWLADFRARAQFYNWYDDLSTVLPLIPKIASFSQEIADQVINTVLNAVFPPFQSMRNRVELLCMSELQTYTFGSVSLQGWPLGRLVIIADCAHSPGHVSIYDPENKIMLCGDVTIEINPVLLYSSVNGLIQYNTLYKQMADEGFIEIAADGHRSKTSWGRVIASFPEELRDDIVEGDYVVGKDNCIRFFERFERYHRGQRQGVVEAHRNLGIATIPEIAEALLERDDEGIAMMKATHSAIAAFPYPWRHLSAIVVMEQRCKKVDERGGLPAFEPPDKIIDDPRKEVPWRLGETAG